MFSRSKVIEIVFRLSDFLFTFSANLISIHLLFSILISFRFLSRTIFLTNLSLYTDVVLFFFAFFSKTSANSRAKRARKNERGARERKIHNVCRHLWEKRGLLSPSPPYVNVSSLSPPRSQYQLNWTNGIGDINCLGNWFKYFTIRQK